jgi:hypothetical protein
VWLANTDADTVVSADWLQLHLYFADRGVAAVAGVVKVDGIPGCDNATAHKILEDYVIHRDGSHPHVHGANFGVRADAYLDAGGWKDLSVAEDHCLWGRLRRRGWDTASPSSSVVVTSGRLYGRAHGGFADTLRSKLEQLRA